MIKNYCKGYPCKMGPIGSEIFGRIIGESEDGSWGEIEEKEMFSIPLFSTPGNSVLKTGIIHLNELEKSDFEKLYEFEKQAGDTAYDKHLCDVNLKEIDNKTNQKQN